MVDHFMTRYDAILLVSFGGPEGPEDVVPFLENVLRGRNVPRSRMLEVAEHYQRFGGVSPINQQNRQLISALEREISQQGPHLPIYWGNRNWHPLLTDTMREMASDGIQRAIAFVTSAFSSYSGCRQYRENIQQAQQAVGVSAPAVDKLRVFYNHPGFVEPTIDNVCHALQDFDATRRAEIPLVFTAHSIPLWMAEGCQYQAQLDEACRLVADKVGPNPWTLVYQSRSGAPHHPWLEPDVCDYIRQQHQNGQLEELVIVPIGFISDHIEVLFDLDTEAAELCAELNIKMSRARTVADDPRFVAMIRELIVERMSEQPHRRCLGHHGPSHDICPEDCCLPGRPPGPPAAG